MNKICPFVGRLLTLACLCATSMVAFAEEVPTDHKPDPKPQPNAAAKPKAAAPKKTPAISAEREAGALAFAQEHHPELATLLQRLQQSAPKEYQAGLLDLDRAVERLSKVKEKSPDRYEIQLTEWKMNSRIRLLAARMSMSDDPAVEEELRAALRERFEVRLTTQRADRDRLQQRADQLNAKINEMSANKDASIERELQDLKTKKPANKAANKAPAARPAETKENRP